METFKRHTPLVSIILPCYNAEKYIEEALNSIITQSYTNLEIIVINDCSSDNTRELLSTFEKDPRVIIIDNEVNLKLPNTLNKAIKVAKGEYIARMDADDIALPDRIEKQVAFLLDNPSIDIVGTNTQYIDSNGNDLPIDTRKPLEHSKIVGKLPWKSTLNHPTIVAKKSFFSDLGGFKNISYGEDYELWIRGWLAGKKFANLPEKLLRYRMHDKQMTATSYNASNARCIRGFLFKFFLSTLDVRFLFGCLLQTKLMQSLIKSTYSIRKHFSGY